MEDMTAILVVALLGGMAAALVRLPPLLGFLVAGFVLNVLGVASVPALEVSADLGVTLLLFGVGLKIDLRQLAQREVWATATVHLVASTLIGAGVVAAIGAERHRPARGQRLAHLGPRRLRPVLLQHRLRGQDPRGPQRQPLPRRPDGDRRARGPGHRRSRLPGRLLRGAAVPLGPAAAAPAARSVGAAHRAGPHRPRRAAPALRPGARPGARLRALRGRRPQGRPRCPGHRHDAGRPPRRDGAREEHLHASRTCCWSASSSPSASGPCPPWSTC